jgi:hypothetical protein
MTCHIWLGCWWSSPNICHWSGAGHVREYRGPKRPKRDSGSNGWHRQCNRCGRLMDDASVNNMDDRSDMRSGGGKED